MRISDWSSDVCSSDLEARLQAALDLTRRERRAQGIEPLHRGVGQGPHLRRRLGEGEGDEGSDGGDLQGWRAEARPPGGEGCQPIMQRAGGNSGRKAERRRQRWEEGRGGKGCGGQGKVRWARRDE